MNAFFFAFFFFLLYGLKKDEYYFWNALVLLYGLRSEENYILEHSCFASWFIHLERGKLLLEHASFSLLVIEQGIQSNLLANQNAKARWSLTRVGPPM